MDARELTLWLAYFQIEGWPEDRADYRSAYTSWTVASSAGGRHKLRDFIPVFDQRPKDDWRSVQAHFAALAAQQRRQ